MKLVNSKEMRSIDARAIKECGISGLQLMENAGRGVAEAALAELEGSALKRVAIFAGKGNNGGDGYVVARLLASKGFFDVRVFSTVAISELKGDALKNARAWERSGGETRVIRSGAGIKKHHTFFVHSALIIDALLGTGLNSDVRGVTSALIEAINGLSIKVLSVDIPSGISGDTGAVMGVAIRADVTVTMATAKVGLYHYPGRDYAGRIAVVDIGMPGELLASKNLRSNLIDDEIIRSIVRTRKADSHKGTNGHLLVIAGSPGKSGAAYLVATAAMRTGAGLVTIALPEGLNALMEIKTTEVMTSPQQETEDGSLGELSFESIREDIIGKAAFVIGPGLGTNAQTGAFLRKLLMAKDIELPPMVIDADGLNLISSMRGGVGILKRLRSPIIITPHPGEAASLLGITTEEVQADRAACAERLTKLTGAITVLKGASTVVCVPGAGRGGSQIYINPTGNAALASAGTGDVLTGMIGAFLANGYLAAESALAGVYLHGIAAEKVSAELYGTTGMLASDLFTWIPRVVNCYASSEPCGC